MTLALYAVDATQTEGLTADETVTLAKLRNQLTSRRIPNAKKYLLYEGLHKARNLEIAVPAHLADVDVHVGAPGTVVDVLAERIEWDQWTTSGSDLYGLDDIYRDNELEVEQARQAVDSLICGVDFMNLSYGDTAAGEPEVLITAESPMNATALWNPRARAISAGLIQERDPLTQFVTCEWLKLLDQTIKMSRDVEGRIEIERFRHNLGVVPMVPFPNRERPSDMWGRSEITPAVRYFTEAIGRSLLGMEIHREIFTAPNRYMLGVDPKMFGIDPDSPHGARIVKQWDIAMSKMNIVPGPESKEDTQPSVGQFPSSPPTPYIEQIKHYFQQISAESATPWNYWGFSSENPPSADAVRVLESRLVKRALLRQRMWTRAWRQVAYIALKHLDRTVTPATVKDISPNWKDPATPTPAAAADSTSKLTGSRILPPTSKVTWRRAGLSEAEIAELEREQRKLNGGAVIDRMRGRGRQDEPTEDNPIDDDGSGGAPQPTD